jgi:cytochrome oxidase assembly protein ShyY1
VKRLPVIPTIIVAAAVATMIALGIWQIGRAGEKADLLERYRANRNLPTMTLPTMSALDQRLLYRRATAFCLEVTGWRRLGGRSASGKSGTRHIAECRTGAEGPGFAADMGVAQDPKATAPWRGGEVTGILISEPPREGVLDRLRGHTAPPRPMIIAARPAGGLEASQVPSPPVGNSSTFYAIQWFFFALVAMVTYAGALRRRRDAPVEGGPPQA